MLGLGRPRMVAEHEAEGELARVYHEIRQVLRVNGVNLVFRRLAAYPSFPAVWEVLSAPLRTRAFFEGTDRVRASAVGLAAPMGRLDAPARARPGESQAHQIRAALALYHDVNPKLLVAVAAARMAMEGQTIGRPSGAPVDRVARGIPARMYPMEMVDESTDDPAIRPLFDDIQKTMNLPAVNSDYRTLALWPGYLAAAWERLKPIAKSPGFEASAEVLRDRARAEARALPVALILTPGLVERHGDDPSTILDLLRTFEQIIAPLILNVTLCALDWHDPEMLARPPFPAPGARGGS